MSTSSDTAEDDPQPLSFGRRTGRVLAVLSVAVVAGLWGYALFWPKDTTPPGRMADPAFSEAAEGICRDARAELDALPAAWTTRTPQERADVVARSNVILTDMLGRLQQIAPPAGTEDGAMTEEWLGDWRIFVGDRVAYVDRLRADPSTRFYVTIKERRQITVPIDFFAIANRMDDCATPTDLE